VKMRVTTGTATLPIKPRGTTVRTLRQTGTVRVDPTITFTPSGGSPRTKRAPLKLVEKR